MFPSEVKNVLRFQKLQYVFECCLSALAQLHNRFAARFFVLSMIRFSKSAQKYAVQVCQVATVMVETTQLVLSQFKNFLS